MLIKKNIPLTKLRDDVQRHMDNLNREIGGVKECIDQRRAQYQHLKHRSGQYFHKVEQQAWEKSNPTLDPDPIPEAISDEEIEIELLQRKEAFSKH